MPCGATVVLASILSINYKCFKIVHLSHSIIQTINFCLLHGFEILYNYKRILIVL